MGERILVVDDSPWEREQLAALFALDGLETITVCDGRRALDRLKAEAFRLIITDLRMPDFDGIEPAHGVSGPRSCPSA